MSAAQEGHRECLSILLSGGAEIDKADEVSVAASYLSPAIYWM